MFEQVSCDTRCSRVAASCQEPDTRLIAGEWYAWSLLFWGIAVAHWVAQDGRGERGT